MQPRFVELARNWKALQRSHAYVKSICLLVETIVKFSDATLKEVDEKIVHPKSHGKVFPAAKDFFSFPTTKLPEDTFALAETMDFKEDMDPLDMAVNAQHSLLVKTSTTASGPEISVFKYSFQDFPFIH